MMQLKLFTMQVIPLAFCFGVAYWMLITANTQEGNLKSVGKTLGWSIITVSIISTFFGYYIMNNAINSQEDYPGPEMMQYHRCNRHHGGPMMDKSKFEDEKMEKTDDKEGPDEDLIPAHPAGKGIKGAPVKK